MPLRIAFDLDGVLADMEGELGRQAELLFGDALVRRPADARPEPGEAGVGAGTPTPDDEKADSDTPSLSKVQLSSRQQSRLWKHVGTIQNFWETLAEIEPGAVAHLAKVATDRRWEIIFLTKRPSSAGDTSQLQSQRWLEAKGFRYPSVYVVQGSRGRIAASLGIDFVIDDRPENCLDVVVDSKARAVLVWREDKKLLPGAAGRLGIGVVTSIEECLNILVQVDAPPAEKPGAMDKVMRLLGLKQPAGA